MGLSGAIVLQVIPGSGAALAGMRGVERARDGQLVVNDIIVGIDTFAVQDTDDLLNALEHYEPGATVVVKTVRRGEERTFRVRLGEPE